MIALIVPGNLKFCPYVQYYTDHFDKQKIEYEIITWNKCGIQENVKYHFDYSVDDLRVIKKTFGYMRFIQCVKKIINRRNYRKIIVFTIAPALMLSRILLGKYRGEYILDIRDDSVMKDKFPKLFKKIVDNASSIICSSPEYIKWIGRNAIISHNVQIDALNCRLDHSLPTEIREPYRIMFAGALNEWEINLEMIKRIGNMNRFRLIYRGTDSKGRKKIENYVADNHLGNVVFYGPYKKEEIYGQYRSDADYVNIIRKNTIVNRDALPNKLYDAVVAGRPIIVFAHNIAVSKYAEKYNLGIVLDGDVNDNTIPEMIEKIEKFDYHKYISGREMFVEQLLNDYKDFLGVLDSWSSRGKS